MAPDSVSVDILQKGNDIRRTDQDNICRSKNLTLLNSILYRTMKLFYLRRGIYAAFNAALFFSLNQTLLKFIPMIVSPFQAVVGSVPIVIVVSLILIIYKGIPPPKDIKQYIWLLPSGIAVAFLNIFIVLALRYMSLVDVNTVCQFSVILVSLLGWIILRETPRLNELILSAMAFVGVVFATRPTFIFGQNKRDLSHTVYDPVRGGAFALLCAILIAVANVVVRKQSKLGIHPYISSIANATLSLFINLTVCISAQNWTCQTRLISVTLIGAGLFYAIAQISLFIAFYLERVTLVTIIMTSQIVFAFLWQFIFFRISPMWTSVLGGGLVMVACIGSLVKRKNSDKSEE